MICQCGCREFIAFQPVVLKVITDEDGMFLRDVDNIPTIIDHDDPYGPYECAGCGREYDELWLPSVLYSRAEDSPCETNDGIVIEECDLSIVLDGGI